MPRRRCLAAVPDAVPVSALRPAGEPPGDREVVLEAANVSREFGGVRAVNGVSFTHLPAYRRARLGLVRTFQVASEFKRLTVMENLLTAVPDNRGDSFRGALAGRRYWRGDEAAAIARAEALLERFSLDGLANSYAGDLSGGQRRLVKIMRALMAEPRVLLLDEPMAGVHPNLARRIGNELVARSPSGT